MKLGFQEKLLRWIWIIGAAHVFVWGPCVAIDFLFCRGKMLRDPFSLILIEAVSVFFVLAKARQLRKN